MRQKPSELSIMIETLLKVWQIEVYREEPYYDKACDQATKQAHKEAGIDECGHSSLIEGWERFCCNLEIELESHVWVPGGEHVYKFNVRAMKYEEEDS